MLEKVSMYINLTASLFTIAATIIAVITLLTWKKQQLLSSKMNIILDAEVHYMLLIGSYIELFSFFFNISKLSFDVSDQPSEIKIQANKIINDERQKLYMEKNTLHISNYQTSIFRLKN